ncbi:opsin-VA-like [Corapipo altera]|uniref:opsin-VA-like n=1 Tax=Corapipo altera TaxID=415028 RepID=UPI000FD62690|nr:opsin-VA-like [Corapipo altera]
MDAFRAFENESLLPSSSGPASWDPFRRPLDSIQPWHFRLLAAVMLVVTSLSLAENLAVILVTFKFKQLRQPVNYVVVNLSVADFLVSLTGGTISFLTNLKGYFYMGYWACVLEGFAVTFFGVKEDKETDFFRRADKALSKYSGTYADHAYIIVFFTTCFIVPLLVILVSYGKLVQKLKKVSETQGRLRTTRRPERQVTRMVVVMIIAFLICWMPYAAFSILVTADPSIELDPCLAAIPAFFSKTATVYNPIIYVFMNKQFRRCLIQMFRCNATGIAESNVNPTSERAVLTQDRGGSEMSTMAVRSTASERKIGDEHGNCQSFAQLASSGNKICPT